MPFADSYQPRHSGGWHHPSTDRDSYQPRHADDTRLLEDVESITGLNARTLLQALRAEGLTIVREVAA